MLIYYVTCHASFALCVIWLYGTIGDYLATSNIFAIIPRLYMKF